MNRGLLSRWMLLALAAASLGLLAGASPALAAVGFKGTAVEFSNEGGAPVAQAGSHPFAFTTNLEATTSIVPGVLPGEEVIIPDEQIKDVEVNLPPGLVGNPLPVPRCSSADFLDVLNVENACPNASAIGVVEVNVATYPFKVGDKQLFEPELLPVFNLVPPPGVPMEIGFTSLPGLPVTIEGGVNPDPPYNLQAHVTNIPQTALFYGSRLTLWGVPADPIHDDSRGICARTVGTCPVSLPQVPFLTLPRSCAGPLSSTFTGDSWMHPGVFTASSTATTAPGMGGCERLGFKPTITAKPTTLAAQSPTGLDFSLDVHDEGLTDPSGLANSDIKKAEVTLPEGMSVNPSLAEGLNVCTQADLARETVNSVPGAGCPNESKIGTVQVQTPLLDESVDGALFVAKQKDNPFNSLIAMYLVIKNQKLGIIVKQALKVTPDPVTGQLTTTVDDIPQLPFSHFKLHFREGTRSPLASPPACGSYDAKAVLTPWAGGAPITTTSAFQIITGPGAGPCPSGNTPPFHPGLEAGTLNNAAGHYSPFYLRLSRNDGEQEFTHFSIKLPPGIVGKLAGVPFCPDAGIAKAKAREHEGEGALEQADPSCPAASEIGRTLVGAGVGPALAYAPGKVYLAGPYHGSALSIAAITAAKVGPFDLGTVVVRQALKINPETAEVFIDATGSDPIPHIIDGIPVHARDIRVYVDKPNFVLNPTNCTKTSTASTVLGSGLNFATEADDQPVTVTSPFQAADCASLGFAPKLALSVKGGSKRGGHPRFKAVLTYPKGSYANIAAAQVTLPHSEFLDQSHIKTICTRVQFNAGTVPGEKCPAASIYGFAKAITPLLDEPIQGPVFLRSSSHNLPDVVAALHSGKIDINLVGRIDSVKGGRIRNTFESVPDAPVTSFTLQLQGGKKGLLVNSTDLCNKTNRAISHFTGQNGKVSDTNPALVPDCGKGRGGKKQGQARRQARAQRPPDRLLALVGGGARGPGAPMPSFRSPIALPG